MSKMSITKFEEYAKAQNKDNESVIAVPGMADVEVKVRHRLSLEEMCAFVDGVCDACVDGNGEYYPELYQLALDESMVRYYTDCKLPDDAARVYSLLLAANELLAEIRCNIDAHQFLSMRDAIRNKIENKVRLAENSAALSVQKLMLRMEEIGDKLENVFSGVDSNTLNGVVEKLGNIDEGTLVKAMREQDKEAPANVIAMPKRS